jgi:hypothetical protein
MLRLLEQSSKHMETSEAHDGNVWAEADAGAVTTTTVASRIVLIKRILS